VLRDGTVDDLVATIESASRGELRCSAKIAAALLRRVADLATERDISKTNARLTRREQENACLVEEGLSNKEIAARLFIEVATVKNHVHNILEKLQVRTRGEAAAAVRRRGLRVRRRTRGRTSSGSYRALEG
jgi:DNA-binding NarL/FixJ family response regulator